jgi:hypothetical protein
MKKYIFLLIFPWTLFSTNTQRPRTPEEVLIEVFKKIEAEQWIDISLDSSDDEEKKPLYSPAKKILKRWRNIRTKKKEQ